MLKAVEALSQHRSLAEECPGCLEVQVHTTPSCREAMLGLQEAEAHTQQLGNSARWTSHMANQQHALLLLKLPRTALVRKAVAQSMHNK
jgi:hypothetical protein